MRGSNIASIPKIASILAALWVAAWPGSAVAHGHGGHHGSGGSGFALVPIFAPRFAAPGGFAMMGPLGRWGPAGPLSVPWAGPVGPPGWPGPPHVGILIGSSPIGVDPSGPTGMTPPEEERESDLDKQIGALPPPPPGAAPPAAPPSDEDDSGWDPL
jgi:hypothetical protein